MKPIKHSRHWMLGLVATMILSACSSPQQQAAPVINGSNTIGGYGYENGTFTTPQGTYNSQTGALTTPQGTVNTQTGATAPYQPTNTTQTTGNTSQYDPYAATFDNTGQNIPPQTGAAANASSNTGVYSPPNQAQYTPPAVNHTPAAPAVRNNSGSNYQGNYSPVNRNASTHRVQKGDTIYNISQRYGMTSDQLMQLNGLSSTNIREGQVLRVKAGSSTAPATRHTPAIAATGIHVVEKGDTIHNISQRYGMTWEELRQVNGLTDNNIRIGQRLRVKAGSGAATAPSRAPAASGKTHRVVEGDTVFNISKRYGISEERLRQLNGIRGNNIQKGQVLRVSQAANTVAAPRNVAQVPKQPAPAPYSQQQATTAYQQPAAPTYTQQTAAVPPTAAASNPNTAWQSPLRNARVISAMGADGPHIELQGANNQEITAVADGEVIHVGQLEKYGNTVVIQHDDRYVSTYSHVARGVVQDQQKVRRGQAIAILGRQNLYFTIRDAGTLIDPRTLIAF